MSITSSTLTTIPAAAYTSSGNSVITSFYLCNISGASVTFDLFLVPSAGSASMNNIVYKDIQLAPSDTYVMDTEKIIFSNGDMIQANASANSSIVTTAVYMGI